MKLGELYKEVCNTYKDNHSVRLTADICSVSIVKVRKILITEKLWSSPTSIKIGDLYQKGYSTSEIANRLGIRIKDVQAYIPYTKGSYNENKTKDSVKCKAYRTRKTNAFNLKQEQLQIASQDINYKEINFTDFIGRKRVQTNKITPQIEIGKLLPPIKDKNKSLVLSLEPVIKNASEDGYYRLCLPSQYTDLNPSLTSKTGVSKDVTVPSGITLHKLKFLIQKEFKLPQTASDFYMLQQKDYNHLLKEQRDYSGIIFNASNKNALWDDDYSGKESINTWLTRKYQSAEDDYDSTETYIHQELLLENDSEKNKNILLERLTAGELLSSEGVISKKSLSSIDNNIAYSKQYISKMQESKDYDNLIKTIIELTDLYSNITKIKGSSSQEGILESLYYYRDRMRSYIWPAVNITNPVVSPFTDKLLYVPNINANWKILITCKKEALNT